MITDAELDSCLLTEEAPPAQEQRPPKRRYATTDRPSGAFLKGPIPCEWLRLATTTTMAGVRMALAIWHVVGTEKTRIVRINSVARSRFGIQPHDVTRGLDRLEELGLLKILDRQRGRMAVVEVLDVGENDD